MDFFSAKTTYCCAWHGSIMAASPAKRSTSQKCSLNCAKEMRDVFCGKFGDNAYCNDDFTNQHIRSDWLRNNVVTSQEKNAPSMFIAEHCTGFKMILEKRFSLNFSGQIVLLRLNWTKNKISPLSAIRLLWQCVGSLLSFVNENANEQPRYRFLLLFERNMTVAFQRIYSTAIDGLSHWICNNKWSKLFQANIRLADVNCHPNRKHCLSPADSPNLWSTTTAQHHWKVSARRKALAVAAWSTQSSFRTWPPSTMATVAARLWTRMVGWLLPRTAGTNKCNDSNNARVFIAKSHLSVLRCVWTVPSVAVAAVCAKCVDLSLIQTTTKVWKVWESPWK